MKKQILLLFLIAVFHAFSLSAGIPGKYEIIVPHVPPAERSKTQVTLVEVFAFDCGHCFNFNKNMLPKLESKFGDKIKFMAKPIGWRGHDPGRLYFIAEEKGKGHQVMMMIFDLIFEKGLGRQMFERDKLQFVAKLNGLTQEYNTLMDDPRIVRKMNESVQYAGIRNINSTPTIVIEDVLIPERTFSNIVKIVNAILIDPVD